MTAKLIYQGAEAIILKENNKVIKKRIKKSYRISELDERIRKLRTRREARLLKKASKIVSIPKIIKADEKTKEIIMQFIDGKKLSEHLEGFQFEKQKKILKKIGEDIAKLHNADIIHGDLTTSNMILKNNEIYFIDFGLGFISHKFEDKAVDLHLLRQALEAKHFKHWKELYKEFEKSYLSNYKEAKKVLERLKAVEKRGRYKNRPAFSS